MMKKTYCCIFGFFFNVDVFREHVHVGWDVANWRRRALRNG
jgi:hypothetical protein